MGAPVREPAQAGRRVPVPVADGQYHRAELRRVTFDGLPQPPAPALPDELQLRHARREGEAEGRQEGRYEGERKLLRKQLVLKFGELSAVVDARLDSAAEAELTEWAERILTANALDQVFESRE